MVAFYKEQKNRQVQKPFEVTCMDLDLHCRGVAKHDGRTWFIPNLLPGEKAKVMPDMSKDSSGTAKVIKLIERSEARRSPDCPLQEQCGGCVLQYMPQETALNAKVKAAARLFNKNCKIDIGEPDFVTSGTELAYRRACRFSVRSSHGRVELGFRGQFSHELAVVDACPVLTGRINALLPKLTALINKLGCKKKLGHVEFVDSDGILGVYLRFTTVLPAADKEQLSSFGSEEQCLISIAEPYKDEITQEEKLTETCLTNNLSELFVTTGNCRLNFLPSAFVQVNKAVNEVMVQKVLEAVKPDSSMHILDLFCGLGNFTFALAESGAQVFGVDIVKSMIEKARGNAAANHLSNLDFTVADLEEQFENQLWAKRTYDAVVLDPGRQGAKRAAVFLSKLKPQLIVMISCNPLAASRDSLQLLQNGYKLAGWRAFDMFPRTAHIELMLVFSKQE